MTVSDFLSSRHTGQDLASPNEIIPISFQSKELLNNTDIFCPAKKPPTPVKRVTRRIAQPGEVAPIWPLTGITRKPEHVPQQQHQQPVQRQIQPQKLVVQAEVHAPMDPPEPEVPTEAQKPGKALDQVKHPPTPKDQVEQETEVPEPLQVPIVNAQPKQMVPEQPIPQVLLMPTPMTLPDTVPKVPSQPIP